VVARVLTHITIIATVFLYRHQAYQCNVSMVLKDWKIGLELKKNKSTISAKKYQEKAKKPVVMPRK